MAINWEINVQNPVLTDGMSFRVRHKKLPDGKWVDFLPNPTTNKFIIKNLENGKHQAEIRTVCSNGSLSVPVYVESNCSNGGLDENPQGYFINIFWNDNHGVEDREYVNAYNHMVKYKTNIKTEEGGNIAIQTSLNGSDWATIDYLESTDGIFPISGVKPEKLYVRVLGSVNKGTEWIESNVLYIKPKDESYSCETYTFRNTNNIIKKCYCRGALIHCAEADTCDSAEIEIIETQEPLTVYWIDCQTGEQKSHTLKEFESITVNRRI